MEEKIMAKETLKEFKESIDTREKLLEKIRKILLFLIYYTI